MKNVKWKRMIAGILAAVTCMMNCGLSAAASELGATGDTVIEAVEEAVGETVTGTAGSDIGTKDVDTNDMDTKDISTKDTVSDSTVPDLTGELQDGAAEEEKSEEAVEEPAQETSGGRTDIFYGEQTIEEMISLLSTDVDKDSFFQYSIWDFLDVEDLEYLNENGLTLDDLYSVMTGADGYDAYAEGLSKILMKMNESGIAVASVEDTATVSFSANVSSGRLGAIGAFGSGDHGPMKQIRLNGEEAFCILYGGACSTGMTYTAVSPEELGISDEQADLLVKIYGWYREAQAIHDNTGNYAITQAAMWLVRNNRWGSPESMAAAISPMLSQVSVLNTQIATDLFKSMAQWVEDADDGRVTSGIEFWSNGPNQYLLTSGSWMSKPKEYSAYVVLNKKDAITGAGISQNVQFKIYEDNGTDTGAVFNRNGDTYTSSVITTTTPGKGYYVKEVSIPSGYLADNNKYHFSISEGDSNAEKVISNAGGGVFANQPYWVRIRIPKVDEETGKQITNQAVFTVTAENGRLSEQVTFQKQADGSYLSSKVYFNESNAGRFYVQETKAPAGYYGDWANEGGSKTAGSNTNKVKYAFQVNQGLHGQTVTIANAGGKFVNEHVTGKISIIKKDAERKTNKSQGDAILEHAVYGLYAKENILHPDGVTGVLYKADELVTRLETDASGMASVDGLYLGKYYLKEIAPSEGYLLDTTKYDVVLAYGDETKLVVIQNKDVFEHVKKQAFEMIKVGDDGEHSEAELLQAGFTIYLIRDLSKVKDGTIVPDENGNYQAEDFADYDFSGESATIDYAQNPEGEVIPELFTDGKGFLRSPELAYGSYVVVETTVPDEYMRIQPFIVRVTEDSRTAQTWRVFMDDAFTAKIKIVKGDSASCETILKEGTKYRIYDIEQEKYVEQWITYPNKVCYGTKERPYAVSKEGYLLTPDTLPVGTYRLEEVEAPDGYVLNGYEGYSENGTIVEAPKEAVTFRISTKEAYQIDEDTEEAVITVVQENDRQLGALRLYKQGETLDSYDGEFQYVLAGIKGAEFSVYAKDEILSPDNQGTVLLEKDQLAGTITTGEDGNGYLENLPLGSYYVMETKAGDGFILNREVQEFTISYAGQEVCVVYADMTYINARQKVSLSIEKKDVETKEAVSGAVFGLYAKEPIENRLGEVIVEADTLLETVTSDERGQVLFTKDYPFFSYYVKELERAKGYITNEEMVVFEPAYQGQEVEIAEYGDEFFNIPTTTEVTKEDIASGAELSGATLSVLDKKGNVIDTWTSLAGEKHVIKRLEVGSTYILREEYAPYGYLKAQDVEFTVEDTGEVQSVVMQDEVPTGTIIVNKDGEFLQDARVLEEHWYDVIFQYFKKSLAGVTFKVYAAEDIVSPDGLEMLYYEKDQLVGEIITNGKGIAKLEELPLGKYYLVETNTLEGFVLNPEPIEADLSYVDQDTKVVYAGMNVTNERQRVQITVTKADAETKKALEGAVFGLYAAEDIVNADGKVVTKKDSLVGKAVTWKDGRCVFLNDLPLGRYCVKEMEAPKGYVLSEAVFNLDASYQGEYVKVIELEAAFENYPTKLEISKTDITGEHELDDAVLSIIDKDGHVVETWKSNGTPHYIERIPTGEYTLREETAPYGYKIAADVKFTVEDTKEIQKVSMKDEIVPGKILIEKTDKDTGKGIKGVEFEIRDEGGQVVETLVTDKDGHAESEELPIAVFRDGNYAEDIKYFVVETKAAEGYILDSTPHEVMLKYEGDAPDLVKYTLKLTNTPTEPKLPQTGDNLNLWLIGGLGLVMMALGIVVLKKKCR